MPYRSWRSPRRPEPHERPWVFAGAITLAGLAGFINVVVLGFFHVPVSHMSGAVSNLSIEVAGGRFGTVPLVLLILVGFLLGAALSGLLIGARQLVPGRRYGVALCLEGGVLALATALLRAGQPIGVALAAAACGIQNAMASSYYGLVLRTTHVTGIVTDLGVMLGHWLRRQRVHRWQMLLLLSILTAFFAGGVVGALAFARIGISALGVAAAGCMLAGATYWAWRHVVRTRMSQGDADAAPRRAA